MWFNICFEGTDDSWGFWNQEQRPEPDANGGYDTTIACRDGFKTREIKAHIEKTSENVGDKFPEEARKIHYGEAEERGIYGKATVDEAVELAEEGVNVMPIPDLPEDKN